MRRALACLFLSLPAVAAWAQPPAPSQGEARGLAAAGLKPAFAGQRYGASPANRLDLYLPDTTAWAHHAVVYLHGGGFHSGSRHMANPALVKALLDKGYAVATVDYRLSGEAVFPAAVQDVFAAMGHLRTNADRLKLTGKIFVYGESAGGNLALLMGTAFADAEFRRNLDDRLGSVRPDGVVALYPPVDFARIDPMLRAQGCDASAIHHDTMAGAESRYLGAPVAEAPQKVRRANPITHISGSMPSVFIQDGARDCVVGGAQGQLLADALKEWGLRVTYEKLADAGHGDPSFASEANIAKIITFFDRH